MDVRLKKIHRRILGALLGEQRPGSAPQVSTMAEGESQVPGHRRDQRRIKGICQIAPVVSED